MLNGRAKAVLIGTSDLNAMRFFPLAVMLLCPLLAMAQVTVTVTPPKVLGQKAVVHLKMQNNLGEAVKSARAVCFLLDDHGKMVGQSTKWIIGQNHATLEPKAETTFNFVVTSPKPFATTNLTAKVSFTSIVLAGQKLADPVRDVQIQNAF